MAAPADSVMNTENSKKQPESDSEEGPECSVCLQTCVLPTRLPCSHVFCFLCAKGLALQSRRCAMCRAEIPQEFLERPELLDTKGAGSETQEGAAATEQEEPPDKTFAWFYEGRNGWWQYETRLTAELEAAYQHGERTHDALIAGSIYTLDFNNWMQCRRDDPSRRRRIKRDLATSQHKGVAGLRQLASVPPCSEHTGQPGVAAAFQAGPAVAQQGAAPVHYQPVHRRVQHHGGQQAGVSAARPTVPATRPSRGATQPRPDSSDSTSSSSSSSRGSSPDVGAPTPPRPRPSSSSQQRRPPPPGVRDVTNSLRTTSISGPSSSRRQTTHSPRVSVPVLPSTVAWVNPGTTTRVIPPPRRRVVTTTQTTRRMTSPTWSSSEEDPTS